MSLFDDMHTSFKWTVSNWESFLTSSNPQTESPQFAMVEDPKIEWRLVLSKLSECATAPGTGKCYCCSRSGGSYCHRPQNQTETDKRIISLHLENCKAHEETVSLNVYISILDANNDKVFTRKDKISGVIVNAKKYGFKTFISERVFCSNLFINDVLTILCEIKSVDEAGLENLHLLKGFDSFIDGQNYSDVTLCLGDKKIPAHKVILASKSPIFDKMFSTDMIDANSNEAKVNEIKVEVFYELLRFMYTGNVEKLDELGLEIFKAAHFYQIDTLKLVCEHVLRKTLKIENSIDVLILADDHNAQYLKEHCVAFILKNFKAIMKTAAFKNLSKSHPHLPFELLSEIGSHFLK